MDSIKMPTPFHPDINHQAAVTTMCGCHGAGLCSAKCIKQQIEQSQYSVKNLEIQA